jgi:transposase
VARLATRHGPRPVRLSRRDRGDRRPGAALRTQPEGHTLGRRRAARALEDHDVRRRAPRERRERAPGARWADDGPAFRADVEQFLAPALAPGDVVVLDNLTAHKVAGVREAIARAGASILYLPPSSPDLNPIAPLLAKLKALLRQAAARTRGELWSTIGHRLAAIPPTECAN